MRTEKERRKEGGGGNIFVQYRLVKRKVAKRTEEFDERVDCRETPKETKDRVHRRSVYVHPAN